MPSLNYQLDLVVDHAAAQLLSGSPDHLGVVRGTVVESEQLSVSYILIVKPRLSSYVKGLIVSLSKPGILTSSYHFWAALVILPWTAASSCCWEFMAFKFNGTTFTGCERDKKSRQGLRWCATQVEEDGEMVEGKWEYCHAGCD